MSDMHRKLDALSGINRPLQRVRKSGILYRGAARLLLADRMPLETVNVVSAPELQGMYTTIFNRGVEVQLFTKRALCYSIVFLAAVFQCSPKSKRKSFFVRSGYPVPGYTGLRNGFRRLR